jgi:hypothetical protein
MLILCQVFLVRNQEMKTPQRHQENQKMLSEESVCIK